MEIQQSKQGYITSYTEQNIEQYADCLKGFCLHILQLSKGSFKGLTGIIKLQDFALIRRTSIAKYLMTGCFDGKINFVFPLKNDGIFYNGCLMDGHRQIVTTPSAESYAIIPERCDQLIISIPEKSLSQYLDPAEAHIFQTQIRAIAHTKVDENRKRILTKKLLDIFEFILGSATPLTQESMLGICHSIIGLLFDFLISHTKPLKARRSSHEKILERTIRLMESNSAGNFSLEKISKEIHASKRAIQCAFTSILGITPMRYAKVFRINLLRNELVEAITKPNFTELVTRHSFSNTSRLIREYQEHFGEHPKETHRDTKFSRAFS